MTTSETSVTYLPSPDAVFETFDDEIIVINMATGSYYSLNTTALGIWNLLKEQHPLHYVVAATQNSFEGDPETIKTAVTAIVQELEHEGLLVCSGKDENAVAADPSAQTPLPQHGEATGSITSTSSTSAEARQAFQPPMLTKFTDMRELLLLDPIHEVDAMGWPHARPDANGYGHSNGAY